MVWGLAQAQEADSEDRKKWAQDVVVLLYGESEKKKLVGRERVFTTVVELKNAEKKLLVKLAKHFQISNAHLKGIMSEVNETVLN